MKVYSPFIKFNKLFNITRPIKKEKNQASTIYRFNLKACTYFAFRLNLSKLDYKKHF